MAEEKEKRFHNIMNKLFHFPKPNLSLSLSGQNNRGQKRPYKATESNCGGYRAEGSLIAAQRSPCRPWDRGDLFRRLATFKSMRWFAKPKVVDAVSCGRRGWVNVDLDIIACEVCGARLQFSTPSTWNQQQVEKAALIFSLKLESGHKLLCPWIDNACDESLALFPPMRTRVLVDQYKERSSALLQLSALPVISDSAFESMKNPQLEYFLKQSIEVECGGRPNDSSRHEYLGSDADPISGDLYYQAHRLLSLCGWEPQLLPYMVDSGDQPQLSGSDTSFSVTSHVASGDQNKLCVYVSASGESLKENVNENPEVYYDPNSTVLDCKLCGASIGLWAFATVQQPLELIRVFGYAQSGAGDNYGSQDPECGKHPSNGKTDLSAASKLGTSSKETALNLTIAGGPPPTKQNFRATISLPIIGRNLRARFSNLSSEVRNTRDERHTSHTYIMEGSTVNMLNEEMRPGAQEGAVASNENGRQNELPLTVIDDGTDERQISTDIIGLTKDTSSITSGEQEDNGVDRISKTALQKDMTTTSLGEGLRRHSADKMQFHPVRQHRHFCPWVASTGNSAPGWRQTLSALQKEKVFVLPDNEASPSSPSLIKVDDPITSIRKLFESPPAKRAKFALNWKK